MAGPLRTVLVDSDAESRARLRGILSATAAVVLAGESGVPADAATLVGTLRPDVLVLGTNGDTAPVAELARRFPATAILATGDGGSADAVIQVMRAGALEFLQRPVERQDLAAALEKLGRLKGTASEPRERGRVTAVFSAKGGLGATTVAVNIAVSMARAASRKVVLVELDNRQSDVVTFLDLQPRYSIIDALESVDRMDDSLLHALLVSHESGLRVLAGPSRMERSLLSADRVRTLIEMLAARFDQVVLDLRHEVDPATATALEAAASIVYLAAMDVSALRLGAAGLKAFRQVGIDTRRVKVLVMRDGTADDVTHKHVRDALGLPVQWRVPNDYRAVVSSINTGRPLVSSSPRSKVAKSLRDCAEAIVADGADAAEAKSRPLLSGAWPVRRLLGA